MIKLDSTEIWEILFGIDEWAAGQISDKTLQKLAEALNKIPSDTPPVTKVSDNTSRVEQGHYFSWANANPALFVASLEKFQQDYPIQEWKHHIDMSLPGHFDVIAVRRTKPYEQDKDFLREIGM